MTSTAYEGWAIIELFGHKRAAGKVSEVEQYGTTQLRLDIPNEDGLITRFFGGAAIYSVTPTTEDVARRAAAVLRDQSAPIQPWEIRDRLPQLPASSPLDADDAEIVDPDHDSVGEDVDEVPL